VGGTTLECAVCIGNGAARVVVEVGLNIARNDTTEGTDEVVDLARRSATNSVCDTDTVNTDLVDGTVDGKQIDEIGSERILRRESDLLALALDKLDDFESSVLDVCHVLAVAVLAEVTRSSNNNVESVDAGLDGNLGVVEMASYVGENLGLELGGSQNLMERSVASKITYTKLADGLAVPS